MAGKTVSFHTHCNLCDTYLDAIAKWLSCNGEVWGVGPTLVFASAAGLFLYQELGSALHVVGDQAPVSAMERTLVTSMVLGMLSLMVHLWVCSMRFFQYYLDSVIKDSPNMLLELTTAGLLGSQSDLVPLGTLTRFLRMQQPQIHITLCWFIALCYADYVRKNYCQRFNMPYLEQWQAELQARASRGVGSTVARVNSLVGAVHRRLRGYAPQQTLSRTRSEIRNGHTVSEVARQHLQHPPAASAYHHPDMSPGSPRSRRPSARPGQSQLTSGCDSSARHPRPLLTPSRSLGDISGRPTAHAQTRTQRSSSTPTESSRSRSAKYELESVAYFKSRLVNVAC